MTKKIEDEKLLLYSPSSISFAQLMTIETQMKKCPKVSYNNIRGTAFLLKYASKDEKIRKALVTCEHVLKEKIMEEKKVLTVTMNNINNGENGQLLDQFIWAYIEKYYVVKN